jgi:cell wall-associated NlpC family hydrolase
MSRARARAAVAAVTTGTVAVSGVALAGCAQDVSSDPMTDESSVTSPLNLAAAVGTQAPFGADNSIIAADVAMAGFAGANQPASDTGLPGLAGKVDVGLRLTNPDVTVQANEPVDMGFSLVNEEAHTPLANQLIKVQVELPTGFATFLHLTTNDQGFASYTAQVLTTTRITAVFDGTDAYQSAVSDNIGTMRVAAPPPPVVPVQASRETARDASPAPATVTPPVGSTLGEKAVYLASQQAGKPYVYGAEGPYSFDCSGLVQYVFKQLGRSLPRTAEDQYNATTRVSQYNKQPGDLIFFGSPGNIYHVGIYAGDGKLWAAPHSGEVVSLREIWSTSYSVGRIY